MELYIQFTCYDFVSSPLMTLDISSARFWHEIPFSGDIRELKRVAKSFLRHYFSDSDAFTVEEVAPCWACDKGGFLVREDGYPHSFYTVTIIS